jgi:hypothetical protein
MGVRKTPCEMRRISSQNTGPMISALLFDNHQFSAHSVG